MNSVVCSFLQALFTAVDHLQKDLKFLFMRNRGIDVAGAQQSTRKGLVPLISLSGYSFICDTEKKNEFYPGCQMKIM